MKNGNSLHAILFDLDGTLRHNHPNGFDTFVGYLAELGHPLSQSQQHHAERWTHYYWAESPEQTIDRKEFSGETGDFWVRYTTRLLQAFGIDGDLPALGQQVNKRFDEDYKPVHHVPDDVIPTLTQLRADGYTLGLVSNRPEPLDGLAADLGLSGFFHFTLSAGQAQSWKPAPGIFLQAATLAGCAPEQAAYVGDNFYADIVGARRAGLTPVLIDPKGLFPDADCRVIREIGELKKLR
ncbi:MAG: HAD family hydrolase [Chloroflexi bacterium]|nr:HAD family hydrolase [Chloroflexota bacterium]